MNTSKQINVIIGLLMVFAVATTLYFLWDTPREDEANARQVMENAEFGGATFAQNCSSCHGLTGRGAIERSGLPGAPLNVESNRTTKVGDINTNHLRFLGTITCGRGGTVMPAWSTSQGGALNDFQIRQLVTLITGVFPEGDPPSNPNIVGDPNAVSEEAWQHALDLVNHAQVFDPPKELDEDVNAEAGSLLLNDTTGLAKDAILRLGGESLDKDYELLLVVSVSGNEVEVERGIEGTDAAEHTTGSEVYGAPVPSGTTITSATCGQAAASTPLAVETVDVSGAVRADLGDNFFDFGGKRNPNLRVKAGQAVTVSLSHIGSAPHNMRTAGADGEFDSDDDNASDPDLISGGATGTLTFTFNAPGGSAYRCDFHPDQMKGEIEVTE